MGREFELKYRLTEEALEALLQEIPGLVPITMQTCYYDTTDGSLRPRHWTLRRRLENGSSVCTLKIPLPDGSRGEWETQCPDIQDAIAQLIALGAPDELEALVSTGLVQTCGARFTRLAAPIVWGNSRLELALDKGELLGGNARLPLLELEVELKEGCDRDAKDYARILAEQYSLKPETESKLARALKLARETEERK